MALGKLSRKKTRIQHGIHLPRTGWGPPSDVSGLINHEISPMKYSYIYHKATEIRQLSYRLGAPSCSWMIILDDYSNSP